MTGCPPGGSLRFADTMTDVEALLWDLEGKDPRLRSTITVVGVFDRPPDPAAVADRLERVSRSLPRLRQRVVAGPSPLSAPHWVLDGDFDMRYHLREVATAAGGSFADLLALAEPLAAEGLDPVRPLWQVVLVGGLDAGRAAMVVKLHHCITDGLGAVRLATALFDPVRTPRGPVTPLPDLPAGLVPGMLERLKDDVAAEVRRGAHLMRWVVPWALTNLRDAVTDPAPRTRELVSLARSIRRAAQPVVEPCSPLMTGRSLGVRLDALELSLARARRAAKRSGGTVNDVFLAGALGGLRLYHAKHGAFPPSLRIAVPVSTRAQGSDTDLHNQVTPVRLRLPLQLGDPAERVRLVHELVAAERAQPAIGVAEYMAVAARRLPGAAELIAAAGASVDAVASNVPGSPVPLYLGGARIDRLVPFGPRLGAGCNLTVLSHVDTLHVGINMDPAATPDPGVLVGCLAAGFDETFG